MANGESSERQRHRSPSYPFISLDDAIDKARVVYQHDQRHATPSDVVVTYWGYKPTTSNGKLCLAALKKFGLLEDVGGSKGGRVKLSRLALDIILLDDDDHSEERLKSIQEAALHPKIHTELWERWGPDLPSDASMRATLIREWDFNDTYVNSFIKQYRRTVAFARLDDTFALAQRNREDTIGDGAEEKSELELRADDDPRSARHMHASPSSDHLPPRAAAPAPALPSGNFVDLNYPLIGSDFASLRVTKPMSRESFDLLKKYIDLLGLSLIPPSPPEEKPDSGL